MSYINVEIASSVPPLFRWYVVHTQPHSEKRAAAHLRLQSFQAFLPLQRKTVRHARQFRAVEAPFFPRYLFVRFSVERDRWRSICGTVGVSRLIMANEYPLPIADFVVDELAARATPSGLLEIPPPLEPGQNVRLSTGPFAGFVGRLGACEEKDRVKVLLDLMGMEIAVSTARIGLVPAA